MSAPSTVYQAFYPDSHTITNLTLYSGAGAVLTPQAITDAAGTPPGWKAKTLTFATPAEAVFCTPVFQDPAAAVPVSLTRDAAGTWRSVLDEQPFNPAMPTPPTPPVTAYQEWRLFTATDQGGDVHTWQIKTPRDPVALVKPLGKDPLTGADLLGNDFLLRWTGDVPQSIEVEGDVEDLVDPRGFIPIPVTNITTYAESSVGLSLVKCNSQILPQDGMSHLLTFRLRYRAGSLTSAWVTTATVVATYDLAPPDPPLAISATLLRDRLDTLEDVVQLTWQRAADNPGDGVEIYAYDYLDKKHLIYDSRGTETSAQVDNLNSQHELSCNNYQFGNSRR